MKSQDKHGLTATLAILFLCNLFLGWRQYQLKDNLSRRSPGASPVVIDAFLDASLETSLGEEVELSSSDSPYLLLYAFTYSDCSTCLRELGALEELRFMREDIEIYGLMSFASADEIEQTRVNFAPSIPVLRDLDGHWLGRLDLPKTPWKILVRMSDRRIVYEDWPSNTPEEQTAFLSRVSLLY